MGKKNDKWLLSDDFFRISRTKIDGLKYVKCLKMLVNCQVVDLIRAWFHNRNVISGHS